MDLGSWQIALGAIAVYGARRPDWRVPLLGLVGLQYLLHAIPPPHPRRATPRRAGRARSRSSPSSWAPRCCSGCSLRERAPMRILLGGATGAIGRPLVRRLVAAGHEVVGLTRRPEDRARELDRAGARGVVCDVIDRKALLAIAEEVRPDVVVDETTALPQHYDPRDMWSLLRGDGRPAPARDAEPHRGRAGDRRADRVPEHRLHVRADRERPAVHRGRPAVREATRRSRGTSRCRRSSRSSGASSTSAASCSATGCSTAPARTSTTARSPDDVRRRRMPIVGKGTRPLLVHPRRRRRGRHGARARARAHRDPERRRRRADRDARLAAALRAGRSARRRPLRVPAWPVRRLAPLAAHWATAMPGASNARARRELGWAPERPSVREGFASRA